MQEPKTLTKVSVAVEPLSVVFAAAVTLQRINAAKNAIKDQPTEDQTLAASLAYINAKLREAIGS